MKQAEIEALWSNGFPLTAAFTSTVVLAVLMGKLGCSRKTFMGGGNHFARQLMYLAAADMLYNIVFGLCNNMLPILVSQGIDPFSMSSAALSYVCQYSTVVFMTFQYASLLLECHIAITFLLSIYRCTSQLDRLHRLIVVVWPVGVGLAVLDARLQDLSYQTDLGCVMNANADILFACGTSLCTSLCLGCYIASTRKVSGDSGAVQRRVWSRAQLYPIAALITTAPLALYLVLPSLSADAPGVARTTDLIFWCVVTTLYNAHGLLLSVVYAAQRQYYIRGDPERREKVDFYVAFRDPGSIAEIITPLDAETNIDSEFAISGASPLSAGSTHSR